MGFVHWPTFYFTFIVCGFVLYIIIFVRLKTSEKKTCHDATMNDIISRGRNGDIVAVAYGSKRAKLVKVFTGSRWTHCGFIRRDSITSQISIIEMAHYSKEQDGVIITPLADWLYKHRWCIVAWRPLRSDITPPTTAVLDAFAKSHSCAKADMNVFSWAKTLRRLPYRVRTPKEKYYCSEFVMRFLQETRVIECRYNPASYKPWELVYGDLKSQIHTKDLRCVYDNARIVDLPLST